MEKHQDILIHKIHKIQIILNLEGQIQGIELPHYTEHMTHDTEAPHGTEHMTHGTEAHMTQGTDLIQDGDPHLMN